jgi:hypothetical protein
MAVVDSRVKNGLLKLTAGGTGAVQEIFSCQITSIQINPSTNGGDDTGQETLCGDVLAGSAGTASDELAFTYIADWTAATGSLAAFLWKHRGETVGWEVQFDSNVLDKWSGTAGPIPASQIGGAVGEQITIDITLPILTVTPPTRFGDGQLHTGGYSPPNVPITGVGTKVGLVYPFEPANATLPDTLQDLKSDTVVGDSGSSAETTAWGTGEYALIKGGVKVSWNGTAWIADAAA